MTISFQGYFRAVSEHIFYADSEYFPTQAIVAKKENRVSQEDLDLGR
jgi:hypothetical protein